MCERSTTLVLYLILKIIAILIIPLAIYILRNKIDKKRINIIYYIDIFLLLFLIIMRLIGNTCAVNSSIKGIIINNKRDFKSVIRETNDPNIVERIETNDIYRNGFNKKIYYFNNDKLPLSDKKIECNKKEYYLKNYGNNITSISILLSSILDRNIDPIEILNYSLKNNIFDCEKGADTDELLQSIASNYNLKVVYVDKDNLTNYLKSGGLVIAKIYNNDSATNISCDRSTVVIYNINMQNEFSLLNPSDRDYDSICPSNSAGFGQIIKANTNKESYSLSEINSISYEYITLERN